MSERKKDTGYRLLVDMYVAEQNVKKFEHRMSKFLYPDGDDQELAFRRLDSTFDNELLLALKSVSPTVLPEAQDSTQFHDNLAGARQFLSTDSLRRDRRDGARGKVLHYVHLWTMPDLEDLNLAKRMEFCSEDQLYMELDEAVLGEVQNLVRRVEWDDEFPQPNLNKTFVMATRQFAFTNLGPYLFKLRGLPPFLDDWTQLAQVQNVTGRLNRVTEFWETSHDGSLPIAPQGVSAEDKVAWERMLRELDGLQASMMLESFLCAPYIKRQKSKAKADA
jgi:hypothetical protein